MPRAHLIWNPASGRGGKARVLRGVLTALQDQGWEVLTKPTKRAGHATFLAAEATAEPVTPDAIFALGGDGTLREVAKGVLGHAVPVGFLPGGTANVLAHALGIPRSPVAAARVLSSAEPRAFDVGLAGKEPFLMMVSAGLDAVVIANTRPGLKKILGKAALGYQFVLEWIRYTYPRIELSTEEDQGSGTLVVASNIPLYGGTHRMAPDARWDDGLLDLVLFSGKTRRSVMGLGRDLLLERHQNRRDVSIRQTTQAVINGPHSLQFQLDGDILDARPPLELGLSPHKLQILVP